MLIADDNTAAMTYNVETWGASGGKTGAGKSRRETGQALHVVFVVCWPRES